jgi:RNA polymerase sigma factor for flagellar operon FliA
MRLRYAGEMTLKEIGVALQVKESRACQLHSKALLQLRRALNSRGVSGFSQL